MNQNEVNDVGPEQVEEPPAKQRPVIKFGPYARGVGTAIWERIVQGHYGPMVQRSISINMPRYQDASGDWKTSGSLTLQDAMVLLIALQKAVDFCITAPVNREREPGMEG
jgi:hypothetical protein